MGDPRIDSLHDPYEDQLSAARYKAERDAAVQELQAMRERNIELWMESGMANELVACAEQKAERLGKLVWRLQNRLARSHRREKALRKGMREWRERVIGAPVWTMSAYDLLPEEDLQTLRWVREQGGLDVVKTHAELFQQLKGERDELRELARDYEKRLMPEGYEWPRDETGELLRYMDRYISDGSECEVWHIDFDSYGEATILNSDYSKCSLEKGERVKRPAPKLAADSNPLRERETVWNVKTGERYVAGAFASGCVNVSDGSGRGLQLLPSQLTHTKPERDSWERIEEDLGDEMAKQQCGPISPELACKLAGEFVRRCKALAGVSE